MTWVELLGSFCHFLVWQKPHFADGSESSGFYSEMEVEAGGKIVTENPQFVLCR